MTKYKARKFVIGDYVYCLHAGRGDNLKYRVDGYSFINGEFTYHLVNRLDKYLYLPIEFQDEWIKA